MDLPVDLPVDLAAMDIVALKGPKTRLKTETPHTFPALFLKRCCEMGVPGSIDLEMLPSHLSSPPAHRILWNHIQWLAPQIEFLVIIIDRNWHQPNGRLPKCYVALGNIFWAIRID